MDLEDFIIDEQNALSRLKSRKPMSVRAWINVSPFIAKMINRHGWTIREAAKSLNRPNSTINNLKKIAEWPRTIVSKITSNEDRFTVKDILWLAERKKSDQDLYDLVELHINGGAKLPSRPTPKYIVPRKNSVTSKSPDQSYIDGLIKSNTKVEADKIVVKVEDITLMREILKRLWGS